MKTEKEKSKDSTKKDSDISAEPSPRHPDPFKRILQQLIDYEEGCTPTGRDEHLCGCGQSHDEEADLGKKDSRNKVTSKKASRSEKSEHNGTTSQQ